MRPAQGEPKERPGRAQGERVYLARAHVGPGPGPMGHFRFDSMQITNRFDSIQITNQIDSMPLKPIRFRKFMKKRFDSIWALLD